MHKYAISAALLLAAACGPGGTAPEVSPSGILAPGLEDQASTKLAVISATPQDSAETKAALSIVFSKPLRPLSLAEDMPRPAIVVEPPVPGEWQWNGTSAVTLAAVDGLLQPATRYRVTVPKGLRAADGTTLEEPFVFEFETPRPVLIDVWTSGRSDALAPGDWFRLTFDQRVAPDALRAALTLQITTRGKSPRLVAVEVRPDAKDVHSLEVRPKEKLPPASLLALGLDPALRGLEGPLTMGKAELREFSTYPPLSVLLDCGLPEECIRGVQLHLSTPVLASELQRWLKVTPAVALASFKEGTQDVELTAVTLESKAFRPKQRYTVSVGAGLRDVFGQALGTRFDRAFRIAEFPEEIGVGAEDGFIEPAMGDAVTLGSSNLARIDVATVKLSPDELIALASPETSSSNEQLSFLLGRPQLRKHALVAPGPRNTWQLQRFPFTRALEGQRYGSFALVVNDVNGAPIVNVLHPTNLALTSKLSHAGGMVWVTRLSDGRPVPNASVELRGLGQDRTLQSDAQGVVKVPAEALTGLRAVDHRALLVARSGSDWVYQEGELARREPSYEDIPDLDYAPRLLGSGFVDRGIYRPGERVYFKGWVRQENERGTAPVAGHKLVLALRYRDMELSRQAVQSNAQGGFAATFMLPQHASLGDYSIDVQGAQDAKARFRVAEYRTPQFFADASARQQAVIRGDEAVFEISGEYLFGAKMSGAEVSLRPRFQATSFQPPGSEGFATDAWSQLGSAATASVSLPKVRLDASGNRQVLTSTTFAGHGPATLTLYAGVSDVTQQEVGADASTLVHPGSFYLGVRAQAATLQVGKGFSPSVLAAQPDGARRAGVPVTLELHRESRYRARGDDEPLAPSPAVATCELVTTASVASCALVAKEAGSHYVMARGKDERGNPLSAAQWLWIEGRAEKALGRESWADDVGISLHLDKEEYRPGDTARAEVRVPWKNAEVLVTLEQQGIHWHEQRRLVDGSGVFSIPVDERVVTSATVAVHVARPRSKPVRRDDAYDSSDSEAPTVVTSAQRLHIDASLRRLRVEVLPALSDARPGEKVTVRLRARDENGRGRRAELAVWAVDEGVLMLTGYGTPDVLSDFTPDRPNIVGFADTRDRLGRLFEPKQTFGYGYGIGLGGGRLGGSGYGRAPSVRSNRAARRGFVTTPYFEPSVLTDDNGDAEVTVPLSESLTRYRVMAVAATPDHFYGSGQAGITTSLALMVRPALPRFARVGDRFRAAVALTSKHFEPGAVRVKITTTGLTLHGPSEKVARLGRDASVDVAFDVSAGTAGKARVRFDIEAGDRHDSVEQELPVTLPIVPQAVAAYGKTAKVAGERLGDFGKMRRDYGGLKVSLSSSALVGLDNGFQQLIEYPYGCTEQLTSRLMPLLPLRDLAQDFGIALPQDLKGELATTIAKIVERQREDGGFALWPGSDQSFPWLTAYVFRTLDEAKKRGAPIAEPVLESAFEYLQNLVDSQRSDVSKRSTELAYLAYAFAEYGKPDRELLLALSAQEGALPLFARALLLHAFALTTGGEPEFQKQRAAAIQHLSRVLAAGVHLDGNRAVVETQSPDHAYLFDSAARSTALVLRALLAANPEHPLAERLARGLLSQRAQGTWRSTQETSFALLALDAYRHAQEAQVPDFKASVWLGQKELGSTTHRGRSLGVKSLNVPASSLHTTSGDVLAIQKQGSGTLFYEALLRYAPKELPKRGIDRGFSVSHTLHRMSDPLPAAVLSGTAPGETRFAAGDAVLGEVTITTSSSRAFVVVDIPLPAGLEAIDHELRTTSRGLGPVETEPYTHRELRDDRVLYFADALSPGVYRYRYLARATTRGTFLVPPVRAEEMYSPEVFGRTAAERVEVR
jgi:alpha-2-macroglobulin